MFEPRIGTLGLVLVMMIAGCAGSSSGDDVHDLATSLDWLPAAELRADAEIASPAPGDTWALDLGLDAGELLADAGADAGADAPPGEGGFGAPCEGHGDCESGVCVEGHAGPICTAPCEDDCPAGYACREISRGGAPASLCLPIVDRLCEPCDEDLDCAGGRCVAQDQGRYCASSCEGGCPGGYLCAETAVDGAGAPEFLCVPQGQTCACGALSVGLEKACKVASGVTICYGVQACEVDGWGPCALPDEICDGQDNDCDGELDEGFRDPVSGLYLTDSACGTCEQDCGAQQSPQASWRCRILGVVPDCGMVCDEGWFDVNQDTADGCECRFEAATDHPDGVDANCDGVDGELHGAIFAASHGHDADPGTRAAPVRTIQTAVQKAVEQGKRDVYVAAGVYEESISLAPGVHVYGGYSLDFTARAPAIYISAVDGRAPAPGALAAVTFSDLVADGATLDGLTIYAGDGGAPGASSVAVLMRNVRASTAMRRCRVIAGDGAPGVRGADGADGSAGTAGSAGLAAYDTPSATCTPSHHNAPGAPGQQSCGGLDVSGGAGGQAVCPDYDETGAQPLSSPYDQISASSEAGALGHGQGSGAPGAAGYDGLVWAGGQGCDACAAPEPPATASGQDGQGGAVGASGGGGGGCVDGAGAFVGVLWTGEPGAAGEGGRAGAGGGGGGAGGGVETLGCGERAGGAGFSDVGGSGGGGGSGACGGREGAQGSAGGGSFAVVVLVPEGLTELPALADNRIETGRGGQAGDGGSGGVGGAGGAGQVGGLSGDGSPSAWCAGGGGAGGHGGDGGHGGGGGGGCGGASVGIYVIGGPDAGAEAYTEDNEIILSGAGGAGGAGGQGGASLGGPTSQGGAGAPGIHEPLWY
jgi:hypothetical protein